MRAAWRGLLVPLLLLTTLIAIPLRAENGEASDPRVAAEAQTIIGVLAPIGTFRVTQASSSEYQFLLLDAHGEGAGLLSLRTGKPDRQTRFRSKRFYMEIWNIAPGTDVVEKLVHAAQLVAQWDGGRQVEQPARPGPEQLDEMIEVATWAVLLAIGMGLLRRGRVSFDFRLPHVLQVIAQGSIFLYWAVYWPGVIQHAPAIGVQLILGYAADAFFCFGRFKSWRIGLSVAPVVFSINLFEWFDWHAAFIGLIVAFGAKVWVHRKGRHIFNPSVIGLSVVGVISIFFPNFVHFASAFHTLNIPPNMAEWVLLAALIPQTRYRIVPISIGAILALTATGNPALVRPAIILGFTLLASDPATTPMTDIGKVLFGLVIGFGLPLFSILMRHIGQPDDFAKVMSVAVGNVVAPALDVVAKQIASGVKLGWMKAREASAAFSGLAGRLEPIIGRPVPNLALVGVWLAICISLLATEKERDFEPSLHWNWGTPLVVRDSDDVPRCATNPAFCRPFSFAAEASLWMHQGSSTPTVAMRQQQ